ncbi:fimbrial protein [Enterobacteriaceae bacterium YMB-R22]|jgi:major type 1 subunit fimbrin (pilin)|uniref:fimbrial protein n=1 Tax=Tenebrionicola larvae TaxID=2815733 RepID=UPI002011BC37|nr:fimbrial protein [Tenebrionicola larvae]MBV4412630.1 fimbrial protein [Tenebrionicola larvae]
MQITLSRVAPFSLLALVMLSAKALAVGCTVSVNTPLKIALPTFAIDPNLPVGSILAAKTLSTGGVIGACTGGSIRYTSTMLGAWAAQSSSMPGVYETGVPGVGVKISDYIIEGNFVPGITQLSPNMTIPLSARDIKLTFYRTGPITPGNFVTGKIASFSLPNTTNSPVDILTIQILSGGIRIKSCYAKHTNIIVPLGSHNRAEFSGPGSMTTPKIFNVELTCQGDSLPVFISFGPAVGATSPQAGVIPILSEDLSATGVGVKVMNQDGTPVQFGKQVTYHTNYEKAITIPLQASYIQTGNMITPGSANAAMTFTITQN